MTVLLSHRDVLVCILVCTNAPYRNSTSFRTRTHTCIQVTDATISGRWYQSVQSDDVYAMTLEIFERRDNLILCI